MHHFTQPRFFRVKDRLVLTCTDQKKGTVLIGDICFVATFWPTHLPCAKASCQWPIAARVVSSVVGSRSGKDAMSPAAKMPETLV
jgi:hypothetical protein